MYVYIYIYRWAVNIYIHMDEFEGKDDIILKIYFSFIEFDFGLNIFFPHFYCNENS